MYRKKYFFNQETLRFEKFERTLAQKLRMVSVYMAVLIFLSIGLRISFDQIVSSPKVDYYKQKNENLRQDYQKLENQITKSELFLQEIQKRDDKLYRSVFDLDPLSSSLREGGYGGSRSILSDLLNKVGFEIVSKTKTKLEKLSSKASIQSWSLNDLFKLAKSQQELILSKPSIQPISPADSFWMTSTFGRRWDPFNGGRRMHTGVDLAGQVGLKVFATGEGVVIAAENAKNGYGKEVIVDHGFGYMSRYAHLHKISVIRGQKIKRGQFIGTLGNTGRSTGPHLHYEVLFQDKAVNPIYFYFENLSAKEYREILTHSSN
jgi:murein DD-endopeptidase MepM/ murein hydrolase activator NlpD